MKEGMHLSSDRSFVHEKVSQSSRCTTSSVHERPRIAILCTSNKARRQIAMVLRELLMRTFACRIKFEQALKPIYPTLVH